MQHLNLCIVIPAYKPSFSLIETIQSVLGALTADDYVRFVVVDDGSGEEYTSIFESAAELTGVSILRHAVNLGKGGALKTAFNHILLHERVVGVVTADADGQHLPDDILSVGRALMRSPDALVLGCRSFGGNVPLRSKLGNIITAWVTHFLLGKKIADTQTGLRGISLGLLKRLLRAKTNGYDFEMEMLVAAVNASVSFIQYPISTVYIDDNSQSHFNPLRDSIAIYFVFARHLGNSLVTAVLDYIVFVLAFFICGALGPSLVVGRFFAGVFNFFVGKQLVFKSHGNMFREILLYGILLCSLTFVSYVLISFLEHKGLSVFFAKIVVETIVFIVAFSMQRSFIFANASDINKDKETNWDRYYSERTNFSPTRLITQRILLNLLSKYHIEDIHSFIEIGGGGSCFYRAFRKKYSSALYSIIDKSRAGVSLFEKKYKGEHIRAICGDILESNAIEKADVVFSVGLIEHFKKEDMLKVVRAHFCSVKQGGLVIITFPTPTLIYRAIRSIAEALNMWRFPDEYPLMAEDVLPELSRYGEVLCQKKNWWIGLTQEVLVIRANNAPEQSTPPCC